MGIADNEEPLEITIPIVKSILSRCGDSVTEVSFNFPNDLRIVKSKRFHLWRAEVFCRL